MTEELGVTRPPNDNGIFEFMTPDRAIELYEKIKAGNLPNLEWKFYGRRKPGDPEEEKTQKDENNQTGDEMAAQGELTGQDQSENTEFDFDEEFNSLDKEALLSNESLQLKKRPDQDSEQKKTILSDIMSDIMKESKE